MGNENRPIPFSEKALARINAQWADWLEDTEPPVTDEWVEDIPVPGFKDDTSECTEKETPGQLCQEDETPSELLYGVDVPMSKWAYVEVPEILWLIDQLVPAGAFTLFSGHSKYGMKTTTAMDMALHICAGKPFAGFEVHCGPSKVMYNLEEGNAGVVQDHLKALRRSANLPKACEDNFLMNFFPGIRLDAPEWRRILEARMLKHRPALMIFDNFSYMLNGNENEHADVKKCADTFRHLQKVAGQNQLGTAFMLLAHLKKDARRGQKTAEQVRGSSVWRDFYDTHLATRFWHKKAPSAGPRIINLEIDHRGYSPPPDMNIIWDITSGDSGWKSAKCSIVERHDDD